MAHEKILKLKRSYDKSTWLKKFFFPRKLRAALEQYDLNANADSEINICRIIRNTGSFQRWFFSLFFDNSLEDFFKSDFVGAVNYLDGQDLLQGDAGNANFRAVADSYRPAMVASCLRVLNHQGLLARDNGQAYREALSRHNHGANLVEILNWEQTQALLAGAQGLACLNAIVNNRNSSMVARCLIKLNTAGILTEANCQKIGNLSPSKLEPLYNAIDKLEKAELFTPERAQINLNALLGAAYPLPAADSLIELHTVDLWTADNCLFLEHGEHPASTVKCLINLKEVGLLTVNGNCQKLANKTAPMVDLNLAFRKLREANLLDQQNFDAVVGKEAPLMVASCLVHLSPELLTDENRCRVAAYEGNYFSLASGYEMLKTLPERLDSFVNKRVLWTQANFDVLFGGNNPAGAAGSLFTLHKAGLLGDDEAGQRRRAVVAKHIQGFDNMLHSLYDSEILTTENFDLVAESADPRQTVMDLLELAKKTTVDRTVARHKTAVVDDGAAAVPKTSSVNPAKEGIFRGKPTRQYEYTPCSLEALQKRYSSVNRYLPADLTRALTTRHRTILNPVPSFLITDEPLSKEVLKVKRLVVMLLAALDDREVKKDHVLVTDFKVRFGLAVNNFGNTNNLNAFLGSFDELLKGYFELPTTHSNQAGASRSC